MKLAKKKGWLKKEEPLQLAIVAPVEGFNESFDSLKPSTVAMMVESTEEEVIPVHLI